MGEYAQQAWSRSPVSTRDEVVALRAQVRELTEELEEWRRVEEDWRHSDEGARWRMAFNARSQSISFIRLLMASPGRFVGPPAVREAITENDTTEKHIHVVVYYARQALAKRGINNAIVNSWGNGYMITPEGAKAIKALVGE